jgi:hypothetical protein
MAWISVNQSINALANQKYLVDTSSGGFSITLPEFASVGSYVIIADGADLSVNSVSVLTQTDFPFEDGNVFYIIDTAKTHFEFIFNGFNWLVYNVSREGLKVSDLPEQPSSQISNDDLFLYVNKDGSTAESTAIPYINLKQSIIDGVFTTAEQIVDALNDYDQIANLNVLTFDGQPSSFYLNYANLNNTPFIPTAVSQLSNDLGYITNLSSFTSDNLTEGQVNKYLTEPNFNALFEPAFSEAFRLFSGDFAEETVQDSLDNIQAFPLTTNNSTRFVNITNSALTDRFFPSKRIRIYGASRSPTVSIPTPVIGSAVGNGIFSGASGGNSVRYKVVQYNFLTGEFSASSNETSSIEGIDFESFNQINNISVTFSRTSSEFGVLIYRSVGSASFILIDVLGQKELGQSTQNIEYVDYGKFNFVPWSRKDLAAGNIYTPNTGTVHFPIFISSLNNPSKGWIDTTVLSVDTAANRIQLSEEAYFNPSLIISEDDTEQVQNAINLRINLGINSLSLNDRRYIISSLLLPSNFSFSGKGNATILKRIPWDFSSTNKMISASDTTPENISISNMSIDGNQQNQWLKSEAGDVYNNFAIDLKSENTNSTIERIKVSNIIGGGIATPRPAGFVLNLSKIEDSGMSDFFEYSPLIADDGSDIIVTTNSFKNFTSAIDISLSDNGVFTSNVVQNVGTGVLTFGSKFLISAPNIIRGPAGEFIPGPDVLNSVYDSINIKLEPGTSYVSDVYKYQENGIDFDISANRSSLELRVDKLRQVTNVEELYGEVLVAGDKPLQRVFDINLDETRGEFKFNISSSAVDALLDDFSFSTLKAIDTNHIGLTYNAVLTEFVPSGNIIAQSATGSSEYTVTLTNFSNISLGSRVRMLGHGGTPNLDNLIGTVININSTNANPQPPSTATPELIVTIEYDQNITTAGTDGFITVENKFILAKGRIF